MRPTYVSSSALKCVSQRYWGVAGLHAATGVGRDRFLAGEVQEALPVGVVLRLAVDVAGGLFAGLLTVTCGCHGGS